MTVASNVKQCLASLKGIEASLSSLAIKSEDDQAASTLNDAMIIVSTVVTDLEKRVGELEREEIQYKGF